MQPNLTDVEIVQLLLDFLGGNKRQDRLNTVELFSWTASCSAAAAQISPCLIAMGLCSSVDIYEGLNGRGSH